MKLPSRSKTFTRWTIASLAALKVVVVAGLWIASSHSHAADLTVEVLNAKAGKGPVMGALFNGPDVWLKVDQASKGAMSPVDGERAVLVLRNLPAGTYAMSLFQDENGNGKFDRNPAGTPLERFGFSRDAKGNMGPPAFGDAVFEVQGDTSITVKLN